MQILTGGTLLSRNKEYIVLYRGNDFLPPRVSTALVEMEKRTGFQQDEEELARQRAAALIESNSKASRQQLVAGTLAETVAATSRWGNQPNDSEKEKMFRDAAIARQAALVESLQRKLTLVRNTLYLNSVFFFAIVTEQISAGKGEDQKRRENLAKSAEKSRTRRTPH